MKVTGGMGMKTVEPLQRRANPRSVPLLAASALVLLSPVAAWAQQLWSVESVAAGPVAPNGVPGFVASPSVTTGAGADTLGSVASVQVEYNYLRLGMGYLQLPLADGTVIEAENAVFEDRGGGNLMWTGEVPGAGYESVLFTVQDGHLVGWFGEPGGPKYVVHAGPDGRGTLTVDQGPTGDWCGVETGESTELGRPLSAVANVAGDRPASAVWSSTGNRLDILVLYPRKTERYWHSIGGPAIGVQQLEDYLNMVFRNGRIPATADLISARWDPIMANHPLAHGGHFVANTTSRWHEDFELDPEVWGLQGRHRADLIHFIPDVGTKDAAGRAFLRQNLELAVYTGWSTPGPLVFAHESRPQPRWSS